MKRYTVYCKLFEVEKFRGYSGSISSAKLFQWISDNALVQYVKLPCNCECFPMNYYSFLQPQNFSTLNDLQYTVVKSALYLTIVTLCGEIYSQKLCKHWWIKAAYSYVAIYKS